MLFLENELFTDKAAGVTSISETCMLQNGFGNTLQFRG